MSLRHPRPAVVVGDLVYDLLARMREPIARGTDTRTDIEAQPGGSAASVAAWLARGGVETHFVGRVGDDVFGEALMDTLEHDGVRTYLARDPGRPTGRVVVLVDGDGERTMITDRGAGRALRPQDLPRDLFAPGCHLHLTGYGFSGDAPRKTALKALDLSWNAGMTVSVDPSSVAILKALGAASFLDWTGGAGLCFPNLEEGACLTGRKEPDAIAQVLLDYYLAVVLKLGAEGALYAEVGRETVLLPAAPARVVDTTGAGDALCAGFLAAWLAGSPPEDALRRGVGLAARVVEQIGGRPESGNHKSS